MLAPRNRLRVGAAAAVLILAGGAIASLLVRSPTALPLNNAVWLDQSWTYGDIDRWQVQAFTDRLVENQIGTAYAYVSSLGIDNRWSGGLQGEASFMESRSGVAEFVSSFKSKHEDLRVLGWIEIWTHLDTADGYRLDDANIHSNIADFSRLLVTQLGFDGVLLDVKPLFSDNSDLIRLIQQVRGTLGAEVPIAVAVTADLTPPDRRLQHLESIAPGTMWSTSFKKRVMVSADELVLLLYQSYRQEALDYVNWVAYHVETYVKELESTTNIVVSIPNYSGASSAHNPAIETMARALDGVIEGLRRLDAEERKFLTGIAIYSDEQLSQTEWDTFRDLWLRR
ncbi:MAG: hypothetical protein OXG85_15535 [Chloroflexi bacterium]|nr:hypothetical protein [Chloroflexota bacterium]